MPLKYYNNENIGYAIIRIELLSFFWANPHTRDTLKGFSIRLFMNCEMIARVMDELIEVGIVEKLGNSDKSVYKLKVSYSTLAEYSLVC